MGAFGQENYWNLDDQTSFSPLPEDVRNEIIFEEQRKKMVQTQKESLKKTVLDTWRGMNFQ